MTKTDNPIKPVLLTDAFRQEALADKNLLLSRRSLEYTGEEGKKLASFQLPILLSASLVSLDFAINMANRELEKQGVPIIPEFPKLT